VLALRGKDDNGTKGCPSERSEGHLEPMPTDKERMVPSRDGLKEWRVSWDAWPHAWPGARRTERVYSSKAEAIRHYEGLKSMEADHEPRPCDDHVWAIRLDVRDSTEWSSVPTEGRGNMTQPTPRPLALTPDSTWIGMQPDEDVAVADCGCTLHRSGDMNDDPAMVLCPLHAQAEQMRAALEQIAKGEGAFNRDPLKHAANVIEEAKELARALLATIQKGISL
jgi:hypothetical protein